MATTRTGQPTSQGQDTLGSEQGQQGARDRRAAGDTGGIAQTLKSNTIRKLDDQKTRASDTLGSVAGAVRGMTDPLRQSGQEGIAEYVDKAAEGIERWASQLRNREVDDAVRAVQNFARRQPALFLGIAFGAGVLAARFLKSSAEETGYRNSGQSGSGWGGSSESMRSNRGSGSGFSQGAGFSQGSGSGDIGRRPITSSDFGTSPLGTTGDTPRISSDMPSAREVL